MAGRLGGKRGTSARKFEGVASKLKRGALIRGRGALRLAWTAACVALISLGGTAWRRARAPRVWRPGEPKVAFWSWRTRAPAQAEVEGALRETGARVLFVRAGQFDLVEGRVVCIRGVEGELPRGVEVHLVYNATPALLARFENTDERALAAAFVETFKADSERAAREGVDEGVGVKNEGRRVVDEGVGVKVSGLQLDLDVPTRLLARYGRVLKETRAQLPRGARLSVTGLETWMDARELKPALEAVDFWLPQFYGAEIPQTVERVVPVSSSRAVARGVARARELGKPFYAGLAAYGYAILYSEKGRAVELRGDIAPARVASDRSFELVERRAFEPDSKADGVGANAVVLSEWRYVFRAREETVVDGLAVRAGERIVLDVPSSESLRAGVRGVREGAGESLLGICIFRLPTRGDETTLSLAQIAAALADRDAQTSVRLTAETARAASGDERLYGGDSRLAGQVILEASNDGTSGALYGADAFALTLSVPRGSVRGVTRLEGFDSFETLCETNAEDARIASRSNADDARGDEWQARSDERRAVSDAWRATLRPCSAARASVVRLRARTWPPGARARVGLSFNGEMPAQVSAWVEVRREDGRAWEERRSLSLKGAEAWRGALGR